MDKEVEETFYYQDRAENLMPSFSYWGDGITVIKAEQWYKSRLRIIAILKTLSRIGKKYKKQRNRIKKLEEITKYSRHKEGCNPKPWENECECGYLQALKG